MRAKTKSFLGKLSVLDKLHFSSRRHKLVTVDLRASNQVPQVYGAKALPLLQGDHPLARMYILKAHEKGHEGAISTPHRSRKEVWIIGGRVLA
jgi:hypothetical protein